METVRTHRVGTITTGLALIAFGVLFVLHLFMDAISYEMIFKFWPVILIGLGIEVLISSFAKDKVIYDKPAIVLTFFMTIFAMGMAYSEMFFEYFRINNMF